MTVTASDCLVVVSKNRARVASGPRDSHVYHRHLSAGKNGAEVDERRYAISAKHVPIMLGGDCYGSHFFLGMTAYA